MRRLDRRHSGSASAAQRWQVASWRFRNLLPSPRAFLDCTLPGHVRTLYSAPGNGAALHSHGSEETFVALTGRWEVCWGDEGRESVVLEPFDGVVVPDGVLRGFRNAGEEEALLLTILGAHNAGHCVWAESLQPAFAEAAR